MGDRHYRHDPYDYLLVTVELPDVSHMLEAPLAQPYLSLSLALSTALVGSVMANSGMTSASGVADIGTVKEVTMTRKRILAIDGGGIRGIIPLCALVELERQLNQPARTFFSFMAGTSTGAIISAGLALGLPAERCLQLYTELGDCAFRRNPLDWIISLGSFKYRTTPLVKLLREFLGNPTMNQVPIDVMFTTTRVRDGKPFYFVKDNPANEKLTGKLRVVDCVAASAAAPTFFEPWHIPGIGACVDGGVGIAGNPCYQACVEAFDYMPPDTYPIAETTVVSLGTGFYKSHYDPSNLIEWVQWVIGELLDEPAAQQTQLVERHYVPRGLHLVRLNVQMPQEISMDGHWRHPAPGGDRHGRRGQIGLEQVADCARRHEGDRTHTSAPAAQCAGQECTGRQAREAKEQKGDDVSGELRILHLTLCVLARSHPRLTMHMDDALDGGVGR